MHDDNDEHIDIVTAQETHVGSEENLRRRRTIPGYTLYQDIRTLKHLSPTATEIFHMMSTL
jgi:hypothetical protein